MEPKLGANLGSVRVHTSGESAEAAKGFGARAFTIGEDVHFNSGEFQPGTKAGDKLLAHELTHVVQGQKSGVQRKADGDEHKNGDKGGPEVSDPGEPAEKEADATGEKVGEELHGGDEKKDAKDGGKDKKDGKSKDEKGADKEGEGGSEEAGGEKKPEEQAPAIGAKLEPGTIPLAKDTKKAPPTADYKNKRYVIKAERKGGKDPKAQTIQGTREEVVMGLRSLQLGKEQVTAADIVGMGNLAMGSLEVSGTTPAGIIASFNVDVGKAGLQTIFSSGSGASVEGVEIPIYDGTGKLVKGAKPSDPLVEKTEGQIILTPGGGGAAAAGGAAVQVADDAEQKKFLEENTSLVDNRGYVPTLDKHSEATLWQAVRLQDAQIAAKIKELGLAKITSVIMKIYSEREMCGQCAAKSAEMMGSLQSHAPQTFAAIQQAGGKGAKLGTDVDSTHPFQGGARQAPPGQANPSAPVATPPSGNTSAGKAKDKKKA
jgi:hypothetical protein